jgi:hypothetical protein
VKHHKTKLAVVPNKRHLVSLLRFCRRTCILLETVVTAFERGTFNQKNGVVWRAGRLPGMDLDVWEARYRRDGHRRPRADSRAA